MIANHPILVSAAEGGLRLDALLARHCPSSSRALILEAVAERRILLNDRPGRKGDKVAPGDRVWILDLPERADQAVVANPAIPLAPLYEDDEVLVLDKPAGLPVHPLARHERDTLANGLLARYPALAGLGPDPLFPAFIHRIDRDTSGLVLVAKTETAYANLRRQFQQRAVTKTYVALVHGSASAGGVLDQYLAHAGGRDAHRMIVVRGPDDPRGRHAMRAVTEYAVTQTGAGATRLTVVIRTGVTHQIRCQLAAAGHPLLGDRIYGPAAAAAEPRLFLHAQELALRHPRTDAALVVTSPVPAVFAARLAGRVEG